MRSASPRTALALLIAAVAAVKIFLQARVPGFLQGDDVETLEAAFRAAFGLEYADWEIRSHLLPELLVAPCLRATAALADGGIDGLLLGASIPFIVAGAITTLLVFRLGRAWGLSDRESVVAAVLHAVHAIPVMYGIGGFPRPLAGPLIAGAALLATRERALHLGSAGFLVGIAGAARYSEWIFLLPLLAMVASGVVRASRPGGGDSRAAEAGETPVPRGARLAIVVAGFLLGATAVGLYDVVSGEGAFSSLLAFAAYTLEGRSSSMQSAQPSWWYLARIHQWLPLTALPLLVWGWRRSRRNAALWIAIPLFALSVVHHKELRYLQNVIPFLAIAIAAGVGSSAESPSCHPERSEGSGRGQRETAGPRMAGRLLFARSRKRGAVHPPASSSASRTSHPPRSLATLGMTSRAASALLLALTLLWSAWGVNRLDRRSSAAVAAARAIAAEGARTVAVEQAWAYGNHLYFPESDVIDLGIDPTVAELGGARDAQFISLYASHATPEWREALARLGFAPWREFAAGGRPVAVFRRSLPPG